MQEKRACSANMAPGLEKGKACHLPARAVHYSNNASCCAAQDIALTEAEAAKARAGAAAGAKGAARLAREAEKAQKEAAKVEADLAERDREFKARAHPAWHCLWSQELTRGDG